MVKSWPFKIKAQQYNNGFVTLYLAALKLFCAWSLIATVIILHVAKESVAKLSSYTACFYSEGQVTQMLPERCGAGRECHCFELFTKVCIVEDALPSAGLFIHD